MAALRGCNRAKKECFARCIVIERAISFVTPQAGEPVDKHRLTQVGRALKELSVQMIPAAYSPQARGRSERSLLEPGKAAYRRNSAWPV